ncbi:nuclear receptor ROR-beta-like [Ylistrum balloti]|uniref:nuclear receptor ROR-beta-like n=1 Tax=Ylistrum balloti TaxID=509963 RepID=UPI002905A192|nr:nuclear receptor ROR-beta-like [Ylistrum balloti]
MEEKISLKTASLLLPPCKVCDGKASGIHYGVNSCEACKGFFRRYLSRKEPYKCSKKGKCVITDSPRGNCSACRMEKCLRLGMSKEAVRQGRYTLTERTKAIMEVQKLQQKVEEYPVPQEPTKNNFESSPEQSQPEQSPDSGIESQISPADLDTLENSVISNTPVDSPFTVHIREDRNMMEVSSDSQSEFTKESGPLQVGSTDSQNIPSILNDLIPKLTKSAEELSPVSSKLTDQEIHSLHMTALNKFRMKEEMFGSMEPVSIEEYNHLYEATGLDVDGRQSRLQRCRSFFEGTIKHYVQFSRVIPEFPDLPVPDQSSLLKAARFEFFMLLEYRAVDPDLQMVLTIGGDVYHINEASFYFPKEIMLSWFEFSRVIRRLNLSDKERALVLAISLVFRDRCKLEDPERVERIQLTLISYLRHVLRERYGRQEVYVFSKVMNMFLSFRELTESYMKQYQKLCKDKFLPKQFPEMLEFLFEDD